MTTLAPIGVFDSGVGGLTVLRALRACMPSEDFVYLGDTARLPYGSKSAHTVARYSLQCAQALQAFGIRCLVVACNTASASAIGALQDQFAGLPIIGVIEAGADAAVAASRSKRIAVIGTESTINGGAYRRAIVSRAAAAEVTGAACSLFVALAEEGWTAGPIVEQVARRYLDPLFQVQYPPDTLVLGCTHFPALLAAIRNAIRPTVRIIDSAATTAEAVRMQLGIKSGPPTGSERIGKVTWLATDSAERFARVGSLFLGESLTADQIKIVDL
jgi:glutamate racemase